MRVDTSPRSIALQMIADAASCAALPKPFNMVYALGLASARATASTIPSVEPVMTATVLSGMVIFL